VTAKLTLDADSGEEAEEIFRAIRRDSMASGGWVCGVGVRIPPATIRAAIWPAKSKP
jgi:hypothetical protein